MFLNKKYQIIFSCLIFFMMFFALGQFVLAAGVDDALGGLNTTAKEGYGKDMKNTDPLSVTIGKVVGAGLAFLGTAFFILMIYGGYTWMFSMGNEQTATKAKDIIIAAVIGLVIVLLAYAITSFLGNTLMPSTPATTTS